MDKLKETAELFAKLAVIMALVVQMGRLILDLSERIVSVFLPTGK